MRLFHATPGRRALGGGGGRPGKKKRIFSRTGVDRAAAILLKSQPAPKTGEAPGAARNGLIFDIRSSSAEPTGTDPEGARKTEYLC